MVMPSHEDIERSSAQFRLCVPRSSSLSPSSVVQSVAKSSRCPRTRSRPDYSWYTSGPWPTRTSPGPAGHCSGSARLPTRGGSGGRAAVVYQAVLSCVAPVSEEILSNGKRDAGTLFGRSCPSQMGGIFGSPRRRGFGRPLTAGQLAAWFRSWPGAAFEGRWDRPVRTGGRGRPPGHSPLCRRRRQSGPTWPATGCRPAWPRIRRPRCA